MSHSRSGNGRVLEMGRAGTQAAAALFTVCAWCGQRAPIQSSSRAPMPGILTFILRQKSSAGAHLIANVANSPELAAEGSIKVDASRTGQGELSIQVRAEGKI